MELLIKIKNRKIQLIIKRGKSRLKEIAWEDERNLLETILLKIEALLKSAKIELASLNKVSLKINMEESYSTYQIAKSVEQTLNFCLKQAKQKKVLNKKIS